MAVAGTLAPWRAGRQQSLGVARSAWRSASGTLTRTRRSGEMSTVRCPLCAAPAPAPAFAKQGWPIARCVCGLVFVARAVSPDVLERLYGEGYFAGGFDEVVPGYRGYG